MKILGISAGFHDASISVLNDQQLLFAGHSERYSKKKHDPHVCNGLLAEALDRCGQAPDAVVFYERPWVKKARQLYAGQYADVLDLSESNVRKYLLKHVPDFEWSSKTKFLHVAHHLSHAASAFQTSTFDRATVVVIDAIGEWDTVSILGAEYDPAGNAKYTTLWKQRYPNSIGLFYTAMTQRAGLRPLDEEYILMGMAGYGNPTYLQDIETGVIDNYTSLRFKQNFHRGTGEDFLVPDSQIHVREFDLAASAQAFAERFINAVMDKARGFKWSENLVYAGGVALNCSANRHLGNYFDRIWLMPNPGDAGASLGAAAAIYGKRVDWENPYLGTNIPGRYPVAELMNELRTRRIAGVANGRAEFGPRALGNRSLLADPRGPEIKDAVNEIKRRQKFRPFAPVILEEYAHEYFKMPKNWASSPYMQVTADCIRPTAFPAIIHVDGTSRVQTVSKTCGSGIRELLEEWYAVTGCPMLLNTSLNIRGEPMVNDRLGARRFSAEYGINVF